MTVVLFSPHNDDAALFAAFACVEHDPLVVTVLRSQLQQELYGITAAMREAEDKCAFATLGVSEWAQWPYLDTEPDWGAVENAMRLLDERIQPERVFAPAVEQGGHEQHNTIGQLALDIYGAERVTGYLTYASGGIRSTGTEVPLEPSWIGLKLAALACYRSQLGTPSLVHFVESLREYVA
jgi:LmbE family N-acetylglucosaminyl deacetylase